MAEDGRPSKRGHCLLALPRALWLFVVRVALRPDRWSAAAEAPDDTVPVARSESWTGQTIAGREQVIRHVTFRLRGEKQPVLAYLEYRRTDPYAVHLMLHGTNPWAFSRDLLRRAAVGRRRAGIADVQWSARGRRLVLDLTSPDGEATLTIPRTEVVAFLRESYTVVPRGAESDHLGLDAALARLLEASDGR